MRAIQTAEHISRMPAKEDPTVHDLLQTILVPSYPPNRSQWRKLELALKFINLSKKSARDAKTESNGEKKRKVEKHKCQNMRSEGEADEPAKKRPRLQDSEPCKTIPEQKSNWTKVKCSLQKLV